MQRYSKESYPKWNELVPSLNAELSLSVGLRNKGISFRVSFKSKLLLADLGAENHMLNMFKFNSFYGCHYCTAHGKTIGKTPAKNPVLQNGDVREPSDKNNFVEFVQLL